MSDIKPIKSRDDYESAIDALAELINSADSSSPESEVKINLLSQLIEDFENLSTPRYKLDPIESIKFRIEQLGLEEKDLAPYLGGRSRVSEVLSGKRTLTIQMIRNLEDGLDIPSNILIGGTSTKKDNRWMPKTLELMAKRGYFGEDNRDKSHKYIVTNNLLQKIFGEKAQLSPALLRQSSYNNIESIDKRHLEAWTRKILIEAEKVKADVDVPDFNESALTQDTASDIFKLSRTKDGPTKVIESFRDLGIVIIIEPSLPGTKLDGATIFENKNPVIGLTLRYNRSDSFWFTLAHEIAHVLLHKNSDFDKVYDFLESKRSEIGDIEDEADRLGGELLIPKEIWNKSPLRFASTPTLLRRFAEQVGVADSVVAGRIQFDTRNWAVHSDITSGDDIRGHFKGIVW